MEGKDIKDDSFNKYRNDVINKLKDRFEDHDNGIYVKEHFRYPDPDDDMFHILDMVVVRIDEKLSEKVEEVYNICSKYAFEHSIAHYQLLMIEQNKLTGAAVFLTYKDKSADDELIILSLSEIAHIITENENKNKKESQTKVSQIDSINTLVGFYNKLSKMREEYGKEWQFFFRGQPDVQFKALPSIFRKNNIGNENLMFREAIRRNPLEFTDGMSTFDKLVKMQHYGLPTRLLDITTNPLVALFFACQKDPNANGEVLVYPVVKQTSVKYFDSHSVCILANLVKRPANFTFVKENEIDASGSSSNSEENEEFIQDILLDIPSFKKEKLNPELLNAVLCVLPKLNNDRIINQKGAFFIYGMGDNKEQPAKQPDEPVKIIVNCEAKPKLLQELELLGINEASLFPETDKVMKQIKQEFCGN